LPKILWLMRHEPAVWSATHKVLHAADFVVARLTGQAQFSDWSNALKSGYDLLERRWPDFFAALGIDVAKLPAVEAPGKPVGHVCAAASAETGLPAGTTVIAGCTDGTASLLASGISGPGEWNSTLGTTLAIRGISQGLIRDPMGRIYCHLHPDGFWLPGGASNTGAAAIAERFGEDALQSRAAEAVRHAPYRALVYPLMGSGERMPFICADAHAFTVPPIEGSEVRLGAWLQGQALVERWCFELCQELGAVVGDWIAVTGGAAQNEAWLRLRANVLGRHVRRPKYPFAAFGTALLAMAGHRGQPVSRLIHQLVRFDLEIAPDLSHTREYTELLGRLRDEVRRRGWSSA
jgi:xylulokinase